SIGASTVQPRRPSASASGRISNGVPVMPCRHSTPRPSPAMDSGDLSPPPGWNLFATRSIAPRSLSRYRQQPRAGSGNIGSQSEQFTVAFCAVDAGTLGSCEIWTTRPWPPVEHAPTAPSDQQGGVLFWLQAGTVLSLKPPAPFDVWLTTLQSKSPVAGSIATVCVMQGGCSDALISDAMRSSDGPKFVSQIGSTRPFAPNWLTNSTMRTDGSAKLPSEAVHECPITGQGHCAMVGLF